MNEQFITNWNEIVTQNDVAYILGDFSMAFRSVQLYAKRLLSKELHIISGNHDMTSSANKASRDPEAKARWIKRYLENGFTSVKDEGFITIEGIKFRMHHMPYLDLKDNTQNHKKHRPIDDGIPLLCGHCHRAWDYSYTRNDTLMINVGVDVRDYKPISELEILKIYNECNVK